MTQVTYRGIFPLALFFLMTFIGSAQAYLLTASQITRQMVKALGPPVTVTIHQKETLFRLPTSLQSEGDSLVFDEVVALAAPDRCHSVMTVHDKRVEQFSTAHVSFRVVDGVVTQTPERVSDHYRDLLQFRKASQLKKRLSDAGVDLLQTSLNRHDGGIAWVMGAAASDSLDRPQLWVDKETFLPLRWILWEGGANPQRIEIWYHHWFKHGDSFFPRRVAFYAQGRLFREIRVESVAPGKALPATLFNRAAYRKKSPVVPVPKLLQDDPSEKERQMKEIERILSSDPLAF